MSSRGAIHSARRARQLHDFSGLSFGRITPTDLDGLIDYHDRAYALLELKSEGADLPTGQQLALTRLVDIIEASGRRAALFVAEHAVRDADQQVDASRTRIRWIYQQHVIVEAAAGLTLRAALDDFFAIALTPDLPAQRTECPLGHETVRCTCPRCRRYQVDVLAFAQRTRESRAK